MKLIVQIPCLNEAATLPAVLSDIPKKIAGIDTIEILVMDDGSTDDTVAVAKKFGVEHFVYHTHRQGLGRQFHDGVIRALELGADIVVNTDGDNAFPQAKIAELVQPIVQKRADIVIGNREVDTVAHYSATKKLLQKVGSKVVNLAAGTDVPDAACGFRAYSRESLMRINTVTRFSYCTETIIQAGNKGLAIASLPIVVNAQTRASRLFKSNWEHVFKSSVTIVRAYLMYKPYMMFMPLGIILLALGIVPFVRYSYYFAVGGHSNHLLSLIVGVVLLIASFLAFALGVLADLTRTNRSLIEDELEHTKRLRFDG